MKEVQNIIEWVHSHVAWVNSLKGPEVESESLNEWLELEEKAALRRGGRVVAGIGVGLLGFLAAGMLTFSWLLTFSTMRVAWLIPLLSAVVSGGLTAAILLRMFFRKRGTAASKTHRESDAMAAIAHLRNLYGYRGIRRELGEHGVMELNEGAQIFLRCRSTLSGPPWDSESSGDPWSEARSDLMRAMESAMDRLALFVVKKRPFSDIGPVLDEMRAASNEIQRITAQRSTVVGGAGRDLRASLARMKELAAAEDELMRVQE